MGGFLSKEVKGKFDYLNRINKNIVIFVVYGLLFDVVMNMYKPFAVKYLERLGGTNLHITLYNSLPGFVAALVLFPCLLILSSVEKKKQITCVFIFISRFALFTIAFLPVLKPELRPLVFVIIISLMNFPEAISQASMQNLSGSLFDGKVRSMAISLRNKFGNLLILIVVLLSGLIISYVPKSLEQRMVCYQIFFVLAFVVGLFEVYYFSKLKEEYNSSYVPNVKAEKVSKKDVAAIFKDKKFISFAFFTLTYYVCFHGGWAVSSLHTIKNLGANEFWLAITSVTSGLSSFMFASSWNKIIVKKGNEYAMVLSFYLMGFNTMLLVLSPNLPFLIVQSFINGIGGIGITITLMNGLLINTPDKNRLIYIGVYNTMVNLSLGLSPLLVQFIMDKTSIKFALTVVCIARYVVSTVLLIVIMIKKRNNSELEEV